MRPHLLLGPALVVALLAVVAPDTGATPPPSAAAARVDVTADGVTADLVDADTRDVLATIAARARVRVVTAGGVPGRTTAQWRALPLEHALRRVLAPADLVFVYAADGSTGSPRLVEVRVYDGAQTAHRAPAADPDSEGDDHLAGTNDDDAARILDASDDHRARLRAVKALAGRDDDAAIAMLVQAVGDEDPSVREAAVKALGRAWDERAVEPLSGALRDDLDTDVREAAARALANHWTEGAADALGSALANDRSRSVREAAAEALGVLGDAAALPALLAALEDRDGAVRERAAEVLGSLRNAAALAALLRVASDDGDPWVSEQAARAAAELAR